MERLTTRHCGVAVIKDKSKLKEAMEKLANYEENEEQEGVRTDELVEALIRIKDECEKHSDSCSECPFGIDDMCIIGIIPCDWDIEKFAQVIVKVREEQ